MVGFARAIDRLNRLPELTQYSCLTTRRVVLAELKFCYGNRAIFPVPIGARIVCKPIAEDVQRGCNDCSMFAYTFLTERIRCCEFSLVSTNLGKLTADFPAQSGSTT
jgi:hypothetical protein